jgi:glycosyltransferase involved in cell wall biosynthesis
MLATAGVCHGEPGVLTLIVPTYRRPTDLLRCLASVQQQHLAEFELLVVDNAADAQLAQRVAEFNRTARISARYVAEPRLGLHNARHAGVRAATGDVLVFTDDDATFDPNWLAAYARRFAAHPEMAAAGGPARPIWEVPPPDWLLAFMRTQPAMFPVLSLLEPFQEFRLAPDGYFFGVNMAIRREVLLDVGGFNPDSFGNIWLGDGETGLNRKLWRQGLLVGYIPEAVAYHHVPPERMTLAYFRRREANDGACDMYARFHQRGVPGAVGLLGEAAGIVSESARDWLADLVLRGRTDPRSLRVQLRSGRALARLHYVWRLLRSPQLRDLVTRRDWLRDVDGLGASA